MCISTSRLIGGSTSRLDLIGSIPHTRYIHPHYRYIYRHTRSAGTHAPAPLAAPTPGSSPAPGPWPPARCGAVRRSRDSCPGSCSPARGRTDLSGRASIGVGPGGAPQPGGAAPQQRPRSWPGARRGLCGQAPPAIACPGRSSSASPRSRLSPAAPVSRGSRCPEAGGEAPSSSALMKVLARPAPARPVASPLRAGAGASASGT